MLSEGLSSESTWKEPKPKLLSPDIFRWGGGLPPERVGAKKFGMCLEPREINLFGRDIPGFCPEYPGSARKVWEKNVWVQFSWGPKSSVCASNPGKSNFSGGISRDFVQNIPEAHEKFEKENVWVQCSFPILSRVKQTVSGDTPWEYPPDTLCWTLFRFQIALT